MVEGLLASKMREEHEDLLAEFRKATHVADLRGRSHDAVLRDHGVRLEELEDRVAKLELKKK